MTDTIESLQKQLDTARGALEKCEVALRLADATFIGMQIFTDASPHKECLDAIALVRKLPHPAPSAIAPVCPRCNAPAARYGEAALRCCSATCSHVWIPSAAPAPSATEGGKSIERQVDDALDVMASQHSTPQERREAERFLSDEPPSPANAAKEEFKPRRWVCKILPGDYWQTDAKGNIHFYEDGVQKNSLYSIEELDRSSWISEVSPSPREPVGQVTQAKCETCGGTRRIRNQMPEDPNRAVVMGDAGATFKRNIERLYSPCPTCSPPTANELEAAIEIIEKWELTPLGQLSREALEADLAAFARTYAATVTAELERDKKAMLAYFNENPNALATKLRDAHAQLAERERTCSHQREEIGKLHSQIDRLKRQLSEREEYTKKWIDAAMEHYPLNWAFDPISPKLMVGNIVEHYQAQLTSLKSRPAVAVEECEEIASAWISKQSNEFIGCSMFHQMLGKFLYDWLKERAQCSGGSATWTGSTSSSDASSSSSSPASSPSSPTSPLSSSAASSPAGQVPEGHVMLSDGRVVKVLGKFNTDEAGNIVADVSCPKCNAIAAPSNLKPKWRCLHCGHLWDPSAALAQKGNA